MKGDGIEKVDGWKGKWKVVKDKEFKVLKVNLFFVVVFGLIGCGRLRLLL